MKSFLSIILFFILLNSCQSQLDIVKQFDKNEYLCSYSHLEGVNLYATFNTSNNEIKFYDNNHSFVKSMTYSAGEYLNRVFIYGLSKDVFNSNNKMEFLIQSFNGKGETKMELIDEDNIVIQSFVGNASMRAIGNKYYIVESEVESDVNQELREARTAQTDKLYEVKGKFRKIIY